MPRSKAGDEASAEEGPRWKRYGEAKEFKGKSYHGMKVGGVHRWTYPDGQWTERKAQPDRWDITYTSLKRRNKRAPRISGAEVGSGYHWFITAHQWVEKLDANTYATHLEGSKYLVAFKKPDWPVWNTQFRNAKRRAKERTIAALQDAIRRIEADELDLEDPQQKDLLAALVASFGDGDGDDEEEGAAGGVTARPHRPAGRPAGRARPARRRRARRRAPSAARARRPA